MPETEGHISCRDVTTTATLLYGLARDWSVATILADASKARAGRKSKSHGPIPGFGQGHFEFKENVALELMRRMA
jgi:hypothetical protein